MFRMVCVMQVMTGLRARLGRPDSRSVVVWAVLASVISGIFAAAFAARIGWETARPLRAAETRTMLGEILPGREFPDLQDPPAFFTIYGQALSWNAAGEMVFGDGGEYSQASIGGVLDGPPVTADLVSRNLRAYGWKVDPTVHADIYECTGPPCDPTTIPQSTTVSARRGDATFSMEINPSSSVILGRATPIAVYPFGLVGGLLGATAAFLLFGWVSRRTEEQHPARAGVKALLGVTLLFWWVPTLFAVPLLALHHIEEFHPTWHPMWEWLGQPTFSLFFLIGCGSALLGLALAALPSGEPVTAASPE
jgi:hypothetical protein